MAVIRHLGNNPAIRIDDHAAARVIDRSLVAGFSRRYQPDAVLVSASWSPHLGLVHGEKIGHVYDNLGALQRKAARDFWNPAIEANQQPNPPNIRIHNRATSLAERKPILVMGGEKLLVVVNRDFAIAIQQHAGIE